MDAIRRVMPGECLVTLLFYSGVAQAIGPGP
jgi:hypothetical protein